MPHESATNPLTIGKAILQRSVVSRHTQRQTSDAIFYTFCTAIHIFDLLSVRGVAHLVVHGTSGGSTSCETIPHVRLESSGGVQLSTVDMVVQRRDRPRRLRDDDDDDDDDDDYYNNRGLKNNNNNKQIYIAP